MKLNAPFEITPRLLAGLRFTNKLNGKENTSWLSIEFGGWTNDGRARYRYHLDTPGFEYSKSDLKSGVGGGSLQEGMESLLSFLSACVEGGENADLFPASVAQWASDHENEIQMYQCELEENKELIED